MKVSLSEAKREGCKLQQTKEISELQLHFFSPFSNSSRKVFLIEIIFSMNGSNRKTIKTELVENIV